jgi:hypothetical protein
MKRGFIILVLLVFSISYISAAMHSSTDFMIKVDTSTGTLQNAVDGNYFVQSHTYSSVQALNPGHSADEIWVSVKDGEMNLLQALSSMHKLCPNPSKPTTYKSSPADKSKPYHLATEIQLASGKSLQQAINDGEFPPGPSCYPPGSQSSCTSAGMIQCDGSCGGYSFKAKGTGCSGSGSCSGYWGCNGAGNCVCVSGSLSCYGSNSNSIILSYSYSNSLSGKVSIFRGSSKSISYTGSSGSGRYTNSGLSQSKTYTFYLRDGTSTSSPLLAQISCKTKKTSSSGGGSSSTSTGTTDYSNLADRIAGTGTSGGGCFLADTLVLMADGSFKEIKDIIPGEMVTSYNTETNEFVTSTVGNLIVHDGEDSFVNDFSKYPLVKLTILTKSKLITLKVTANHLFYSPVSKKFKPLSEFSTGDRVKTISGEGIIIWKKNLINETSSASEKSTIVYNLEITEGPKNYLADGVIVHNAKQA